MSNILQALNESLADEIMAIAKAKGMNPRLRGTPEQERERTQQMLAQRAKDREMNPPPKPTLSPEQVQQLKQQLEQEQKDFDPYYEYSDDHGYWTKQKEKAQRINSIKRQLKDAGVELKEAVEYKTVSMITEARTYKLWESAGQKLVEAQLTADQINQIFQYVQNIQTAGGDNRTLLGKGKDAASAVNKAWEDLKTKVQNSGPIKNVDALYDKAAEQLKQATGGDQGVMKYVQKYRDFAKKHPVAQSLIYSALIAAAGISGAGLGGAAALGLFKMVDKLLQGEKFSSAAYSGAKTGAMAYGASKIGDLIKGPQTDVGGTVSQASEYGDIYKNAFKQGAGAARQAIESGQVGDYNSVLDITDQIMADIGTELSPQSYSIVEKMVRDKLMAGIQKESIELSESQIYLVINKITEKNKLQEGIMDTLKGAAGKAVDYAKTKGTNLTTKVTADKLLQAWKKAGSPTDSLDVASIIQKAGVPSNTITQVYNNMKIPAPGQQGGGADIKRDIPVDPSSVAPPPSSPTATEPSSTATAPTTTEPAQPKAAPSTSDYQKVKQLLAQLDKRGKMNLVKTLEKELAVTEDILSLTESELQLISELSPETLASYKKKAGQSASQADKEGNYKLGDKRFSGIVRATKKELDKDVAKHKQDVEEGFMDMFNKKEQSPKGPQILYYVKNPDGTKTYINIKDAEQLADVQKQHQGKDAKTLDLSRQDVLDWLQSRGVNLRKFWPGATITVGGRDASQNVEEELDENLHKWFKEKWVRFGPDGKIRGDCARGSDSEGKPKCLPQSKAHSLGKKGRASAAARKRREDPNPERSGKAINVNTKKKSNESLREFAPMGSGDNGDDGFDDNTLKILAAQWWNGDEDPKVEKTLAAAGWEIGQDEGYDNGGVFVVRAGDVNGNSYMSWPAEELTALSEACWKGYHKEGNKKMFGKTYPNCVKNTNEEQEEKCPHCGGPMFSEMIMNEKKDACYYKVKSRYKVWPSAYASGALVKCRKKGASNWGTGGKK